MASSADVRDIMGLANSSGPQEITKEMILGTDKPKKIYPKKADSIPKRPEGMARELYNLLYNDSKDAPPLIPTDTVMGNIFRFIDYRVTTLKSGTHPFF